MEEVSGSGDESPSGNVSAAGQPWWRREVIYQIFTPTFQDSDGDGIGDLGGILSRIDYLAQLGIGAVWLTPVYPSPLLDAGYDITDFTGVGSCFGDLNTFDRLLAALHERGIRLILDFVPNHTSAQHPWFIESRSSRESAKRDWYVWADPAPGGLPPNNWLSRFGASAWTYDKTTGQSYYHAFLPEQPDLNWRNPDVRAAMHEVMRFWLERGVDGFRIDAAAVLAEDALLRDEPPNPDFDGDTPPPERFRRTRTDAQSVTLDYLAEMRRVADAFPDRVLLGEVDTTPDKLPGFYGDTEPRLHLPLNYRLVDVPWKPHAVGCAVQAFLDALPENAWPDWVLGSHDKPRVASRLGADPARVAAMLLLTLPGTPILYAGDEIGMPNVPVPPSLGRDPFERCVPGYGLGRDPFRVPLRWTLGPNGGFTTGEPWLPTPSLPVGSSVTEQERDPRSMLNLYRRLIELRRRRPELLAGRYRRLSSEGGVLAFARWLERSGVVVALNLSASDVTVPLPGRGRIVLGTGCEREGECAERQVTLAPHEGVIIAQQNS
ncbi:alpha-amylase family glycosyl hydrolase [Methylobacterium oxalidis]|uniref:Alpha-amylase n=1 Tax=Methylobacterium oxalidis TaxID=944322 RepID=A0A512JAR0_9HYPH|nr:alpha-amylase family glycosyl hydrolase [Methylobacterium oxalidis]GEP07060.1 alpha-amylase [Methylobacterium oxalidis]GJE34984.1 Oligo-1,6-glucosidase [Methylobacterium oxalidis]GLS67600.1 alpha-amylase [Methylobacterium oxalidis]